MTTALSMELDTSPRSSGLGASGGGAPVPPTEWGIPLRQRRLRPAYLSCRTVSVRLIAAPRGTGQVPESGGASAREHGQLWIVGVRSWVAWGETANNYNEDGTPRGAAVDAEGAGSGT
jgi:hypothetical protein